MIAKITGGKSFYGVLKYNTDKLKKGEADVLLTNHIPFPLAGEKINLSRTAQYFKDYIPPKCRTVNPVVHISINPSPDDHLSDEMMLEVAQDYLKRMGYDKQPYIIFKHTDIDRKHLHIVTSRVGEDGKKINNYNDFKESKKICRELEDKYNLHPAVPKEYENNLPVKKIKYGDKDITCQIKNIVKGLINTYSFQSMGEFNALLSIYNVSAELIKGEVNGLPYQGVVYSVSDGGKQQSISLKSSRIGKIAGYEALQKNFKLSKNRIGEYNLKAHTKRIVSEAIRLYPNRTDFEKYLSKNGITPVFRENENGRIYGATFIDHQSKTVLNGSQLGKEYSANVFQKSFNPEPVVSSNSFPVFQPEKSDFTDASFSISGIVDISNAVFDFFPVDDSYLPDDSLLRVQARKKRKKRKARNL